MAGEFLVDLESQRGFQDHTLAIAKERIFADKSREALFVETDDEQCAELKASGAHGIQDLDAPMCVLLDRDAALFQRQAEPFGPFFPGQVGSEGFQLL